MPLPEKSLTHKKSNFSLRKVRVATNAKAAFLANLQADKLVIVSATDDDDESDSGDADDESCDDHSDSDSEPPLEEVSSDDSDDESEEEWIPASQKGSKTL